MDESKNWIIFLLCLPHILSILLLFVKEEETSYIWLSPNAYLWDLFPKCIFIVKFQCSLVFEFAFFFYWEMSWCGAGYCSQTRGSIRALTAVSSVVEILEYHFLCHSERKCGPSMSRVALVIPCVLLPPQKFACYICQALYHPSPCVAACETVCDVGLFVELYLSSLQITICTSHKLPEFIQTKSYNRISTVLLPLFS